MMNGEEAIAIARAFAATRESLYWNEAEIRVWEDVIGEAACWMVQTSDAPPEPRSWINEAPVRGQITYIVSIALRRCIGFDLERGRHMLPDA